MKNKSYIILLLPLLYLIWSLFLNHLAGPFFMSRSDPEYPYLLNGLNCITLNFNNIGHTDHPGTPFQMLTGLFLGLSYLFIGQGSLFTDVITRPETYLTFSSLFLTIITFFILMWLGKVVVRYTRNLTGAVILQSSVLLSTVLIDFPLRYTPDRMLMLYTLIFTGITVIYLYADHLSEQKFAIWSGILMGVGFATKFNFLPLLIIPLFLIHRFRNIVLYGLTTLVAFFISILPILHKFKDFRRFITGVATHDGLYGQGAHQIINWHIFGHHFILLLKNNPAFSILLVLTTVLMIYLIVARTRQERTIKEFRILLAFLFATLLGFILVSKHFKIYYFGPVLSLSGLVLFLLVTFPGRTTASSRVLQTTAPGILLFFMVVTSWPLPRQYRQRIAQKHHSRLTAQFIRQNISKQDLIFVEPTWMAGPFVENALVYGISYVAHRHRFYEPYLAAYPNIITWEGSGQTPKYFRTVDIDPEAIIKSGRDIYLYSSPGRNANLLMTYLDTLSARFNIPIYRDTVFINPDNDEQIIRIHNTGHWQTLLPRHPFTPLSLSPRTPVTASRYINQVQAGDYLTASVLIRNNDPQHPARLILRSTNSDTDNIYFEDNHSLQDLGHGWQLLSLRGHISSVPATSRMECLVYYPGKKGIQVKSLSIKHFGERY